MLRYEKNQCGTSLDHAIAHGEQTSTPLVSSDDDLAVALRWLLVSLLNASQGQPRPMYEV